MTFDQLLDHIPGLRRLRSLNASWLRVLFNRLDHQCTWCGEAIGTRRQSWCSDECVKAFQLRCSENHFREAVEKRDRGICRLCGRDTIASALEARVVRRSDYLNTELYLVAMRPYGYARGRFREVDHATPVCEGGGLCGLDDLRLLCGICHEAETARLHGRRQPQKKEAKGAGSKIKKRR